MADFFDDDEPADGCWLPITRKNEQRIIAATVGAAFLIAAILFVFYICVNIVHILAMCFFKTIKLELHDMDHV